MVALAAVRSKFVTFIIGYKANRFIIVERPSIGGVAARLEQGTEWAVNFVHQGQIFGFTTQILGNSSQPVALTFLSYPDTVERTDLRQSQRFPVQLNATIAPEGVSGNGANIRPGIVVDISEGGCLLATTASHVAGTNLSLDIELPTQGSASGMTAEVKSQRGQEGKYLLGLCFTDFGDDGYNKLKAYFDFLRTMAIRI